MIERRPLLPLLRKFMGAGLLFFIIKGLLWLLVPALIALFFR